MCLEPKIFRPEINSSVYVHQFTLPPSASRPGPSISVCRYLLALLPSLSHFLLVFHFLAIYCIVSEIKRYIGRKRKFFIPFPFNLHDHLKLLKFISKIFTNCPIRWAITRCKIFFHFPSYMATPMVKTVAIIFALLWPRDVRRPSVCLGICHVRIFCQNE